jgi:hypothetical protein
MRGNNSVWVGAYQLLRGRAPAQLRGNTAQELTFLACIQKMLDSYYHQQHLR